MDSPHPPAPRPIRPALHGDAGRRLRQYGDAVADAGDRPRARSRRSVGRGRLQPLGCRLGGDGAALGAAGRPPRPAGADAARPLRLHRLDAGLRRRCSRSASTADPGGRGVRRSSSSAGPSTALLGSASPSAVQAYIAARTEGEKRTALPRRLGLLLRPRHDHRPGDRAALHLPAARPRRAAVRLRRDRRRGPRGARPPPPRRHAAPSGARRDRRLSLDGRPHRRPRARRRRGRVASALARPAGDSLARSPASSAATATPPCSA